jgi:glycerol kinase
VILCEKLCDTLCQKLVAMQHKIFIMKNNKYIVSFDQGTTSCRALLIDLEAKIIGIKQKEFTQIFPQSGWVEHDAEEIWATQLEVFEQLLAEFQVSPNDILGIGITNQRETTVIWDRATGKPIHNAIVWQDRRTSEICNQLKEEGHLPYFQVNTGLVLDAYFSGTKIKWLLDNVEGAKHKAENGELCFGTIDTWLIWKMTQGKNHLTDYTNASRTLIFNIKTFEWDEKILKILNIPKSILPQVQGSSSDFGFFEFGGAKIQIGGVAGDQQAALFGQACFEEGMAKNTYGTGCFLLMNTGKTYLASSKGLITTLACDENGQVCYALEGSVFIAGAGIQWLRDGLGMIKNASQSEAIAASIIDEHDVIVVPAFVGLGAPYWDMYARGAIYGLTRGTTHEHIVKATLDAIAYQTKDIINAMNDDYDTGIKELKVDGGASANDYLMQFQANLLNVIVERPETLETTAMGAAYLAGIYLGIWNADTIRGNRKINKRFSPAFSVEKMNTLYGNWQDAVNRTRVIPF